MQLLPTSSVAACTSRDSFEQGLQFQTTDRLCTEQLEQLKAMARLLLLGLLALLACQASAAALTSFKQYRTDAADCHNSSSLAICESKTNCTWCQATIVPSGCYLDSEAKLLPKCE